MVTGAGKLPLRPLSTKKARFWAASTAARQAAASGKSLRSGPSKPPSRTSRLRRVAPPMVRLTRNQTSSRFSEAVAALPGITARLSTTARPSRTPSCTPSCTPSWKRPPRNCRDQPVTSCSRR